MEPENNQAFVQQDGDWWHGAEMYTLAMVISLFDFHNFGIARTNEMHIIINICLPPSAQFTDTLF